MSQEQVFDSVQFGISVMKDHENKLFKLIQTVVQQPVQHYTDKDGNLDRTLVSQQIALRSTLVLSLSNQLGRLQMALYALAAQRVGVDYGEILNEMTEATTQFEDGLDKIHAIATGQLPLSPQDQVAEEEDTQNEIDYGAGLPAEINQPVEEVSEVDATSSPLES